MNSRPMLTDDVRVFLHMTHQEDVELKLHSLFLCCIPGTLSPGRLETVGFHLQRHQVTRSHQHRQRVEQCHNVTRPHCEQTKRRRPT